MITNKLKLSTELFQFDRLSHIYIFNNNIFICECDVYDCQTVLDIFNIDFDIIKIESIENKNHNIYLCETDLEKLNKFIHKLDFITEESRHFLYDMRTWEELKRR